MSLCRAVSRKWSRADKSSLVQVFGSGTWVQIWKASRLLSLLQLIPGRALWKRLPSVQVWRAPMGKGPGSVGHNQEHVPPLAMLLFIAWGLFSLTEDPAARILSCPYVCHQQAGPLQLQGWGGACLWPLNTQLLYPFAHTCPLLFTCTNFLPLPTSYLTLLLPFISAIADVKC